MAELSGKAALAALCKAANALLERDTAKWSGYSCKPSQFISSPAHPLYAGNETLVETELDWAVGSRSAGGVWDIPWGFPGGICGEPYLVAGPHGDRTGLPAEKFRPHCPIKN